jgi:hypothetical protein
VQNLLVPARRATDKLEDNPLVAAVATRERRPVQIPCRVDHKFHSVGGFPVWTPGFFTKTVNYLVLADSSLVFENDPTAVFSPKAGSTKEIAGLICDEFSARFASMAHP